VSARRVLQSASAWYGVLGSHAIATGGEQADCLEQFVRALGPHLDADTVRDALDSHIYDPAMELSHKLVWTSEQYTNLSSVVLGRNLTGWHDGLIRTLHIGLHVDVDRVYALSDVAAYLGHAAEDEEAPALGEVERPTVTHLPGSTGAIRAAWDPAAMRSVFKPHALGFLDGEVSAVVRLPTPSDDGAGRPGEGPEGDQVWFLGRTRVGAVANRTGLELAREVVLHGTAALVTGAGEGGEPHADIYWRSAGGRLSGLFPTAWGDEALQAWNVPTAGVAVVDGPRTRLVLLCAKHNGTRSVGSAVVVVENPYAAPNRWRYRAWDVPRTGLREGWHAGMVLTDGAEVAVLPRDDKAAVYMLGERQGRDGKARSVRLARLALDDLLQSPPRFEAMQVWAGDKWAASDGRCATLATIQANVPEGFSAGYWGELGLWYQGSVEPLHRAVTLRVAPEVTGPWQEVRVAHVRTDIPGKFVPSGVLALPRLKGAAGEKGVSLGVVLREKAERHGVRAMGPGVVVEVLRLEALKEFVLEDEAYRV
jgi:hypothetical protein